MNPLGVRFCSKSVREKHFLIKLSLTFKLMVNLENKVFQNRKLPKDVNSKKWFPQLIRQTQMIFYIENLKVSGSQEIKF